MIHQGEPGHHRVLVVDDDPYLVAAIGQTLELAGYVPQTYTNPIEALATVSAQEYSAVLADIRMPELDGMELLARLRSLDQELPVILITGHGDIGLAVQAVKGGAYDFLQKPVDDDQILATLARAVERRQLILDNRRLTRQLEESRRSRIRFHGLIGAHPQMRRLYELIETYAEEQDPVLITGETGTGKELVARAIHETGQRQELPFVAINMAAQPAEMIESALFGHERGAFTGAIQRHVGTFEYAGQGTLFLDEICSLPLSLQAKLLRVLEERRFCRLGSNRPIDLAARVVAATNRDLEQEVAAGRFRQDLYFRLNVLPITLSPLRERRQDIPLLVESFRREYCQERPKACIGIEAEQVEALTRRDWPGNIRELRNVVRRICILGPNAGPEPAMEQAAVASGLDLKAHLETQERVLIERVLNHTDGRISAAHGLLGISRKGLYDKLKKYGIDPNRFRP